MGSGPLTDQHEADEVERVLGGYERCCNCQQWDRPAHMFATVATHFLKNGRNAGRVCAPCLVAQHPNIEPSLKNLVFLTAVADAPPISSVDEKGTIYLDAGDKRYKRHEVRQATVTQVLARRGSRE